MLLSKFDVLNYLAVVFLVAERFQLDLNLIVVGGEIAGRFTDIGVIGLEGKE